MVNGLTRLHRLRYNASGGHTILVQIISIHIQLSLILIIIYWTLLEYYCYLIDLIDTDVDMRDNSWWSDNDDDAD